MQEVEAEKSFNEARRKPTKEDDDLNEKIIKNKTKLELLKEMYDQ